MINNDVLRSIRYALDLSDAKVVEIIKLAERDITLEEVTNLLKKEDEAGFVDCRADIMVSFLDGLIIHRRGKKEAKPGEPPKKPERRLTNNAIFKKLRVAFELKEEDLHQILAQAGFPISRPELSAVFRAKGHGNYRNCGDQLLRNFLKGLVLRFRG